MKYSPSTSVDAPIVVPAIRTLTPTSASPFCASCTFPAILPVVPARDGNEAAETSKATRQIRWSRRIRSMGQSTKWEGDDKEPGAAAGAAPGLVLLQQKHLLRVRVLSGFDPVEIHTGPDRESVFVPAVPRDFKPT